MNQGATNKPKIIMLIVMINNYKRSKPMYTHPQNTYKGKNYNKEKKTVTVCQVDLFRCPVGPLLKSGTDA